MHLLKNARRGYDFDHHHAFGSCGLFRVVGWPRVFFGRHYQAVFHAVNLRIQGWRPHIDQDKSHGKLCFVGDGGSHGDLSLLRRDPSGTLLIARKHHEV